MIFSTSLLLLGCIGLYFLIGNYFYNFALNPKKIKSFLQNNPQLTLPEHMQYTKEENKTKDNKFREKVEPKRITVQSFDQLRLVGYLYKNSPSSHKWAIVLHGYCGNHSEMIRYVRNFYEQGFHVIAPDLRGHGESEGNYIGMGWHDRKDVLTWINQIITQDPKANIVLFGLSMGGATVMMASGEELPKQVKAIVEDCGYSSVEDIFTYQLSVMFKLPKFPIIHAANTITRLRAGYSFKEASSEKQLEKNTTPILFIHGDKDTFVPFSMVDKVYNATRSEKEKLVIPGAGHAHAEQTNPDLYWKTVWDFVKRYLEEEKELELPLQSGSEKEYSLITSL